MHFRKTHPLHPTDQEVSLLPGARNEWKCLLATAFVYGHSYHDGDPFLCSREEKKKLTIKGGLEAKVPGGGGWGGAGWEGGGGWLVRAGSDLLPEQLSRHQAQGLEVYVCVSSVSLNLIFF